MDKMIARQLKSPLAIARMPSDRIFPMARSDRFTGVTSKVVIVPRSFSPAIESGARDIHTLNRIVIISIGKRPESVFAMPFSSLARSY